MAFDATGTELTAVLASSPEGLCIRVDDCSARYPVTIDPWIGSPFQTLRGTADDQRFGLAVSGAGDVDGDGFGDLVVGCRNRIAFFRGGPSGIAGPPQTLTFGVTGVGVAVSTAGDFDGDGRNDVIAGLPYVGSFQVLVLGGSPGGLVPSLYQFALEPQLPGGPAPRPGWSVAHLGDLNGDGRDDVAFGIPFDNPATGDGTRVGSVRVVFGGSPPTTLTIQAPPSAIPTGFGWSVAKGGDVDGDGTTELLIGAPYAYVPHSTTNAGQYYRAHYASGSFTLTESALAPSGYELARSLGGGGDVEGNGLADAIVGTPGYNGSSGGAVIFSGGIYNPVWSVVGGAGDEAGASVAIAGDVNGDGFADYLVGSPKHDAGVGEGGRADLYFGGAPNPSSTPAFSVLGDWPFEHLGYAVACAGDLNGDGYSDFAIGAPDYDDAFGSPPLALSGRVLLYYGHANLPWKQTIASTQNTGALTRTGSAVSGLGDVNGDGFDDVAIGAPGWSQGQAGEGRVEIRHGSAVGLANTVASGLESNVANAGAGSSVVGLGDFDGDGYNDVAVGAPGYTNGQPGEGAVLIYRGGASGVSVTPAWILERNQTGARFGAALARAGDLNRDGFPDLAVGAPDATDTLAQQGEVWVYYGSPFGPTYRPPAVLRGSQAFEHFGAAVAGIGRGDDDAFDDLVIGGPDFTNGEAGEGIVHVHRGGPSGLDLVPSESIEGNFPGIHWGAVLAGLGDANGDGYGDFAVGCPTCFSSLAEEGEVWVLYGGSNGLVTYTAYQGGQAFAHFGAAVTGAGDVDGNGIADMVVGAPDHDVVAVGSDAGRVSIFLGYASGLHLAPAQTYDGIFAGDRLGAAVAGTMDVNGDGFSEVAVGVPGFDLVAADGGALFVSSGNPSSGDLMLSGTKIRARQIRGTTLASVGLGGSSHHPSAFRIQTTWSGALVASSTAIGRARVQTQLQVVGTNSSFLGASVVPAPLPFVDTGSASTAPPEYTTYFSFPPSESGYKWRVRLAIDDPLVPYTPWVTMSGAAQSTRKLVQPPDCDGDLVADHVEVVAGTATDANHDLLHDGCAAPGLTFCHGDGTGTACPCANHGASGRGCANSVHPLGALLATSGTPSVASDTVLLSASALTGSACVFFQGSAAVAPSIVDDGLGCIGGTIVRLATKPVVSGTATFPQVGDLRVSVRGAIPSLGGTYFYQAFYRNAASAFCPPATSNRTNGAVIPWAP
ncbi:MAG: FG-GAP repeat protein [Planctomycetes bacterium]|nr:FG-GAP repeat protein [Planctomycetota bacterium]